MIFFSKKIFSFPFSTECTHKNFLSYSNKSKKNFSLLKFTKKNFRYFYPSTSSFKYFWRCRFPILYTHTYIYFNAKLLLSDGDFSSVELIKKNSHYRLFIVYLVPIGEAKIFVSFIEIPRLILN